MDSVKKMLASGPSLEVNRYGPTLQRRGTTGSIGLPGNLSSMVNNANKFAKGVTAEGVKAKTSVNSENRIIARNNNLTPMPRSKSRLVYNSIGKRQYHSPGKVEDPSRLLTMNFKTNQANVSRNLNDFRNDYDGHFLNENRSNFLPYSTLHHKQRNSSANTAFGTFGKNVPGGTENSVVLIGISSFSGSFLETILNENNSSYLDAVFEVDEKLIGRRICVKCPLHGSIQPDFFSEYETCDYASLRIRDLSEMKDYLDAKGIRRTRTVVIALKSSSTLIQQIVSLCGELGFEEIFYNCKGKLMCLKQKSIPLKPFIFSLLGLRSSARLSNFSLIRSIALFAPSQIYQFFIFETEEVKCYPHMIQNRYSESEIDVDRPDYDEKCSEHDFSSFVVQKQNLHLLDLGCNIELIGLENLYSELDDFAAVELESSFHFNSLLLYGPPGCGKTSLIFRLISNHFNDLNFLFVPCTDLFPRKFINLKESGSVLKSGDELEYRFDLTELFQFAQNLNGRRSVIVLDNFDEICKSRRRKVELVYNLSLLSSTFNNVQVIGITTSPWEIDLNLYRYFEKKLVVALPNTATRKKILLAQLMKGFQKHESSFLSDYVQQRLDFVTGITKLYTTFDLYLAVKDATICYQNELRKEKSQEFNIIKVLNVLERSVKKLNPTITPEIAELYNKFLTKFGEKSDKNEAQKITQDQIEGTTFSLFA